MTKQALAAYISDCFSIEPDYPWSDIEDGCVFRHVDTRKWFCVGLRVLYRKLKIDRDGSVDIVDVKCDPLLKGAYMTHPGVVPAYHMNKEHWLTILLDGTAEDAVIKELLTLSFELTRAKKRRGDPANKNELTPEMND